MTQMTGGQALIRCLWHEDVKVIFGLVGVQLYHAMDAIYDEPGMQFIGTRHEQATTYMADGYARSSGMVGVAMVVPGPGLQNASAGIGNAYAASSPVLVISGQINRDKIGRRVGVLHEIDDQMEIIRPITKWRKRILKASDIPGAVREAFRQLRTGRPRPVEIEFPPETLAEIANLETGEPGDVTSTHTDAKAIEQAVELLAKAKRPVIWAGGGVHLSGAWQELLGVAEYLQAPVITTWEGKGVISDRHYLSLGVPRGSAVAPSQPQDLLRKYFVSCDVALAVGTRFATAQPSESQQIIQIDVDEEEIGRNHKKTHGIVGDARACLSQLLNGLRLSGSPRPSKRAELEAMRSERYDPTKQDEPLGSFVRAIRESMPDNGILVPDMTQVGYYSRYFYPVYEPRTYLTSSYYLNLGFAYPTALGAKVAFPDRAVVAVCGDGGFLFNSQEMATAVQYGISVVAIVFNDNAYGNVLRDQQVQFKGRIIGAELRNPDFVRLADAYGVVGVRADGPSQLRSMLRRAIASDRPSLIEVPVGPMPSPF